MVCALPVRERDDIIMDTEGDEKLALERSWRGYTNDEFSVAPASVEGSYADALYISTSSDIKRVTLALLKKRKQGGRK